MTQTIAQTRTGALDREAVGRTLRDETAQVLGSVLVHLATLREDGQGAGTDTDVDEIRAAVRAELQRVLGLASALSRPSQQGATANPGMGA